jgi:hypothetical protein
MGRVKTNIEINGKPFWTLFDSGSRNTYITEECAKLLGIKQLLESSHVSLGGKTHTLEKTSVLMAYIEGKFVSTDAYVLSEIGEDEDGKPIEVLFGALAMQKWGIRLILDEEKLDMSHYPKEFVEF